MMEAFSFKNVNLICFNLLLLTLLTFHCNLTASSTQLMSDPIQDAACAIINCGQGTCIPSSASIIGFDCECNPGWKKMQIGPLAFPSCVVPNCTLDFQCGIGSPALAPPLPIPPVFPSLPNLTNSCGLVWCGDGTCMTNGAGYTCNCNNGSSNFMNLTGFACFKPCYLGADCNDLSLGFPPPTPSSSSRNDIDHGGSSQVPNCLRSLHTLCTIMLAVIFISWI